MHHQRIVFQVQSLEVIQFGHLIYHIQITNLVLCQVKYLQQRCSLLEPAHRKQPNLLKLQSLQLENLWKLLKMLEVFLYKTVIHLQICQVVHFLQEIEVTPVVIQLDIGHLETL